MDAKITKKRLNILLSYDWIKIILVAVAMIVLWSLVFTMTATRVTNAQNFTIFNYTGTSANSRFNSYSVGEGDALFAANVENPDAEYADTEGNAFHPTYLQQFLYGYYNIAAEMDVYLEEMEEYLNGYYGGDYAKGEADKQKIETDFRTRIKQTKDKRFKKESEIREGIAKELARIEGYRQAFIDFNGYLESGVVELQETTLYLQNSATGEKLEKTGKFSINLCPDERMEDLKNDVYYYKTVKDEETEEEKKVPTAENVNLVLFDFGDAASDYNRWEGLSFVNYLIQTNLKTGE